MKRASAVLLSSLLAAPAAGQTPPPPAPREAAALEMVSVTAVCRATVTRSQTAEVGKFFQAALDAGANQVSVSDVPIESGAEELRCTVSVAFELR